MASPLFSCNNHCCKKKMPKGHCTPLFLLLQPLLQKKPQGGIKAPLFLLLQLVLRKKHMRASHPPFFMLQLSCYKNKSQMGITPLLLPPIIVIIVTKTHTQGVMLHLYARNWKGAWHYISMQMLQTTNSRGVWCPPPFSFCCWVCNKKHAHTHKKQE
jgi:hypothetical protein